MASQGVLLGSILLTAGAIALAGCSGSGKTPSLSKAGPEVDPSTVPSTLAVTVRDASVVIHSPPEPPYLAARAASPLTGLTAIVALPEGNAAGW